MRILVTGSRSWTNYRTLSREIVHYIGEHYPITVDHYGLPVDWNTRDVVIIHGACPHGADALADAYALTNWIAQEPYPADWKRNGRGAGYARNTAMVDSRPDVCLAFIDQCRKNPCTRPGIHGSHGATHCADLAEAHGIEVRRFVTAALESVN
jgi:hypothetical protein